MIRVRALGVSVASLVVGISGSAAAQPPFEGLVTMRLTAKPPTAAGAPERPAMTQELEYAISGKRVRVQLGAAGMTMLMLPADKKVYMLMPAQNAYSEMPMSDAMAAADQAAANAPPPNVKTSRTGKFETIAGYKCEHVLITSTTPTGPSTTDACISKELGRFNNPMSGMGAKAPAWQKSIELEGFPLKVNTAEGGTALEVIKIEKKRLANSLFTIPENYTKMQVPTRR